MPPIGTLTVDLSPETARLVRQAVKDGDFPDERTVVEAAVQAWNAQRDDLLGYSEEELAIIGRVSDWAGGEAQAIAWYRSQPIPALGGRTPEAIVKANETDSLREYLDHVALGSSA